MLKTTQSQKMLQKAMPIIVQKQNILLLPNMALEQIIRQELEQNPFLEEGEELLQETENIEDIEISELSKEETIDREDEYDISDFEDDDSEGYKTKSSEEEKDKRQVIENVWQGTISVRDNLLTQIYLSDLNDKEKFIGERIVDLLDDDGYLRETDEEISYEINELKEGTEFEEEVITTAEVTKVHDKIKRLDPIGISSRDLQECLLIQTNEANIPKEFKSLCITILSKYMEELRLKKYEVMMKELKLNNEEVKKVFEFISKLNPKPGISLESNILDYIYPDFVIIEESGELQAVLTDKNFPSLKLNTGYFSQMETDKRVNKEAKEFIKNNYEKAKWFLDAIRSRRETMMKVMNFILEKQIRFFKEAGKHLEPMYEKDVASNIGMDISTVSRTVRGKYVQTNFGIYELKSFFSNAVHSEEGDISSKEVKNKIVEIINNENPGNPLTDDNLVEELTKLGFKISRRTVAKYREGLKIPKARLRRKL